MQNEGCPWAASRAQYTAGHPVATQNRVGDRRYLRTCVMDVPMAAKFTEPGRPSVAPPRPVTQLPYKVQGSASHHGSNPPLPPFTNGNTNDTVPWSPMLRPPSPQSSPLIQWGESVPPPAEKAGVPPPHCHIQPHQAQARPGSTTSQGRHSWGFRVNSTRTHNWHPGYQKVRAQGPRRRQAWWYTPVIPALERLQQED